MTKRTRLFVFVATGILVAGLGTGLVASYMGLQSLNLVGGPGPAELSYVPADAQMLAFANVRGVMDSEVRQKLMQGPLAQQGDHPLGGGARKLQEETGINIETDIESVVVSASGVEQNTRPLLIARGVIDAGRIEALLRQHGAVVEDYQGRRLVVNEGSGNGVGFLEPSVVAVGTPAAVRKSVDAKASGANISDNAEMMRLVGDIDDGTTWVVARFDALTSAPQLPAELAKQLPPITWFAAKGHVDGGIRAVVHAETRDETSAKDLREVVQGFVALARLQTAQRPEFADLMNSFQLGGEGKTVSLGFAIPAEMIDALAQMHALRAPQALGQARELALP
jgi:hypothetical protein